tara:strand:+ start:540 stop:1424 length:885 start_codon:yes stop_codon:yes gene_type:complete
MENTIEKDDKSVKKYQIDTIIQNKIDNYVKTNKIPHLIFHGPNNPHKDDIIHYLIGQIYKQNKEIIQKNVMYVNCSHGKGIQFIRNELKFFAKTNINTYDGQKFKSIVLFNADKLTTDAQSALRRCIEQFSNSTRFFIVVNKKERLLKPILSRFCKIYVKKEDDSNKNSCISAGSKHLSKFSNVLNDYQQKRMNWLQKNILKYDQEYKEKNAKIPLRFESIINFAEKIYNKGYSALDLIEIVKISRIEKIKKLNYLLFIEKNKKEFRNEKLLIFFILFLLKMRPFFNFDNILSI